jgi:hypothetical protein
MKYIVIASPTQAHAHESHEADSIEHGRLLLTLMHRSGVILLDSPDGWTEIAAVDEAGNYKRGGPGSQGAAVPLPQRAEPLQQEVAA